ncbi:nose resistant to fluoxetine protein 6-like [Battus philenor]|uniref:nose resistant to fluoxetine protein 6-like n=1 Tax=Battus philenor TaxID=42288 RepID=UPI0035CF591C
MPSAHSRQGAGHSKKEFHLKNGKNTRNEVFENLFVVYDPTFLSMVWPKIMNGVHLNVDRECWNDLSVFYKALGEGRAWAYNTMDASGRYQPGIFQGNRLWLGSKELCFRLDNKCVSSGERYNRSRFALKERDFNDHSHEWSNLDVKYVSHSASIDSTPQHRLAYISMQIVLNITKFKLSKSYKITLGLCLPRSCSPDDAASLVNFSIMLNDHLKSNGTVPRSVTITSTRLVEEHYDIKYDTEIVVLILITLILATLSIVATILDFGLIKCIKSQSGSLNIGTNKYDSEDIYEKARKRNIDLVRVFVDLKNDNVVNSAASAGKVNRERSKLNMEVMKKVENIKEFTPTIRLDMASKERRVASCKRCGKYRKQSGIPKRWDTPAVCTQINVKPSASVTNTDIRKRDNIFLNLLLSFSLKHNCKGIFNTKMANQDLAVVHLMRIFATFWIIFIHVSTIVDYVSGKIPVVYPVLTTGTLAFDTLFFVSGIFSAHHFFYLSSRYTVRELVTVGGQFGKVMQFICFVANRAIRSLPPYLYTIFLTAALAKVLRDTVPIALPEADYENCASYWWRNLLYITLFYPREQQCMQISWYLSTETQLHVCGALLCVLVASKRVRCATVLLAVALVTASTFDVIRAFTDYHKHFYGMFEGYQLLLERPAARVVPYLVGSLLGWLVHRLDGGTRVTVSSRCCLWLVSLCALVMSAVTSRMWAHWASAWLHVSWPAALFWPVLTISTDNTVWARGLVSNGALAALTRLCYCITLLHGIIARWLLLNGGSLCTHASCLWVYVSGTCLLSVLAALLLALMLEMPCCSALRRICDYAYS